MNASENASCETFLDEDALSELVCVVNFFTQADESVLLAKKPLSDQVKLSLKKAFEKFKDDKLNVQAL